jgi:hypothetical protein
MAGVWNIGLSRPGKSRAAAAHPEWIGGLAEWVDGETAYLSVGNYPFDVGTARCSVPATGRRRAGAR